MKTNCYPNQTKSMAFVLSLIVCYALLDLSVSMDDDWENVPCFDYQPDNCDFNRISVLTVEDFDRCGPALVNSTARNYFWGASGRRVTFNDNKKAYKRYSIVPKLMRGVSESSLEITTLGQKIAFPFGFSPVALQKLAHPTGEIGTVKAMSNMDSVMIVSSYSSTTIEEIAKNAGSAHLWMNVYIFKNRSLTLDIISKAEAAGYKAIVVTVDAPISARLTCKGRNGVLGVELAIIPQIGSEDELTDDSITFKDLAYVRKHTKLPVVAKGVLSVAAAEMAIQAGASAILVSNHGGRQLDNAPATIDVLSDIVRAMNRMKPPRDVYVDGGIRNGWDIYKAIGRGAKMAFIGRPQVWGLAIGGQKGVEEVLNILKTEFEETMRLSGASHPSRILRETVVPHAGKCRVSFREVLNDS